MSKYLQIRKLSMSMANKIKKSLTPVSSEDFSSGINTGKNQKSIAIIITYFGKLPWYFEYFVHSCSFNKTIDFFIITDDTTYRKKLSVNLKMIYQTIHDFNNIATKELGFPTKIENGYKLCDFKPTLGLLFQNLIEDYDFWGQCDIDVIFGNIRGFIDDNILENYDFINARHDYTTGCFFLMRNNMFLNTLFKKSKDYYKVLSSEVHFCFDECNFAHALLNHKNSILDFETEIESFTHVVKSAEFNKELKCYFDFILLEGTPGKVKFNHGKIFYKNKFEVILYHLIVLKQKYNPKFTGREIKDIYNISPSKIYYDS